MPFNKTPYKLDGISFQVNFQLSHCRENVTDLIVYYVTNFAI